MKMSYIYTIQPQKIKIMKLAGKWMEQENIVQSKTTQTHVFLFLDPISEILVMST